MKTLKDFIIEARKPNTPYVKPHMQDGKQVGWKSSNKWGKVKYWQPFAKESAMKHAGVTESTLPSIETMRKYDNMADFEIRNKIKTLPKDHPDRKEMEAVHAARQNWS